MQIYYIANSRMPTIKAYGLQIVKTCEAFTEIGMDVELIIPKRHRYPDTGNTNILEYYGVVTPFKITEINSPDLIDINLGPFLNKIIFWIQQLYFGYSLKKYLADKKGIIYSRDQFSLSLLSQNDCKLFWEAHNFPKNIKSEFYHKILSKISGLVVISEGLKRDFTSYYDGSIVVAPDGVDVAKFDVTISKEESRKKLNLSLDKKIAIYTGHLYPWKGADILYLVSKLLDFNEMILVVGGTKKDVEKFKMRIPPELSEKINVVGHISHNLVPYYLKAADCAILTGKKTEPISDKYTSPLKMFEYMAARCPIVAQNLPSFREILNGENSILVESDNPLALTEGIKRLFEDKILAHSITEKAFEQVQNFTWEKRAKNISQSL